MYDMSLYVLYINLYGNKNLFYLVLKEMVDSTLFWIKFKYFAYNNDQLQYFDIWDLLQ